MLLEIWDDGREEWRLDGSCPDATGQSASMSGFVTECCCGASAV